MLTLLPLPPTNAPVSLPAGLSDARRSILNYGHDNPDVTEHMQVLSLVAECRARVLEFTARSVADVCPLLEVADLLDDACAPLADAAVRWDDDREDRQHRNSLDRSRVWRACDLPNGVGA